MGLCGQHCACRPQYAVPSALRTVRRAPCPEPTAGRRAGPRWVGTRLKCDGSPWGLHNKAAWGASACPAHCTALQAPLPHKLLPRWLTSRQPCLTSPISRPRPHPPQLPRLPLAQRAVQQLLRSAGPGLEILDGAVVDLLVEQQAPPSSAPSSTESGGGGGPAVAGVVLASGERILCRSVVITTGTFLRGIIHVGSQSRPAGRIASLISAREASRPEAAAAAVQAAEMTDKADEVAAGAASQLSQRFAALGFRLGRLKTGTPPRIDGEGWAAEWCSCAPCRTASAPAERPAWYLCHQCWPSSLPQWLLWAHSC